MPFALNPEPPVRKEGCPSPSALEALASDELAPEVTRHLGSCADCTSYVAALRAERETFVSARPKEMFLAQLRRRDEAPAPKRSPMRWISLIAMSAGTGAVALVVSSNGKQPAVELKGSLVAIHVQRGVVEKTLIEGEPLHPNDALRFVIQSGQAGYAAVFEKDAKGNVTVVAPFGAAQPQAISAGSTALPDSARLDALLGTETLVTVFSPQPFDLEQISQQLKHGEEPHCDPCRIDIERFEKKP